MILLRIIRNTFKICVKHSFTSFTTRNFIILCNLSVKIVVVVGVLLILCEYAIYPIVLTGCFWPKFTPKNGISNDNETLRAMFIADTHLLGPINGFWIDKLRREWQMYRSFQTAINFFDPEVLFFLGDLFDEGRPVDDEEFSEYSSRFKELFSVSRSKQRVILTGNHDIGFHNEVTKHTNQRFNNAFNTSSVTLLELKGSMFLLLNSMAMKMDGCFLCKPTMEALKNISERLRCEENPKECHRPILLQHFPMYRPSDSQCTGYDAAPLSERNEEFRESYDCLSKEASQFLMDLIKPRLILSGHTHHHCITEHSINQSFKVTEYSIPSFNWRNRNNPSFYLAVITPTEHYLSKCYLPRESTVITLYVFGIISLFIWMYGWNRFKNWVYPEYKIVWKGERAV